MSDHPHNIGFPSWYAVPVSFAAAHRRLHDLTQPTCQSDIYPPLVRMTTVLAFRTTFRHTSAGGAFAGHVGGFGFGNFE